MNEVTPRDWFAGMALQALIEQGMHVDHSYSTLATISYKLADAMMEKREKTASPKRDQPAIQKQQRPLPSDVLESVWDDFCLWHKETWGWAPNKALVEIKDTHPWSSWRAYKAGLNRLVGVSQTYSLPNEVYDCGLGT